MNKQECGATEVKNVDKLAEVVSEIEAIHDRVGMASVQISGIADKILGVTTNSVPIDDVAPPPSRHVGGDIGEVFESLEKINRVIDSMLRSVKRLKGV